MTRLGRWVALTDRELEGLVDTARSEYNVGNAGRLDPKGSVGASRYTSDCGRIGEDSGGIWLRASPEAILVDRPHLWEAVERYRLGHADIAPSDADSLDAMTHSALMVMIAAHYRAQGTAAELRREMQR